MNNIVLDEVRLGTIWNPNRLSTPHYPIRVADLGSHIDRRRALNNPAILKTSDQTVLTHAEKYLIRSEAGHTVTADWFSKDGLYIEDMPIKTPRDFIKIPAEILDSQFWLIIMMCVEFERTHNRHFDDQYFYLTIQQSWVEPDTVQRQAGMHLDGFQKPTIVPQVAQHQLAVTNVLPTRFVAHPFDVDRLPRDKKGMFAGLAEQSAGLPRIEPEPYQLHLLNAFCPHEPSFATGRCFRTFIRFSASVIPFMGADNTRNPMLDLHWDAEAKAAYYASIAA